MPRFEGRETLLFVSESGPIALRSLPLFNHPSKNLMFYLPLLVLRDDEMKGKRMFKCRENFETDPEFKKTKPGLLLSVTLDQNGS